MSALSSPCLGRLLALFTSAVIALMTKIGVLPIHNVPMYHTLALFHEFYFYL